MTYVESFYLVMPLLTMVAGFFMGLDYARDEIRSNMKKPDEK
jgi:hypothetical protein